MIKVSEEEQDRIAHELVGSCAGEGQAQKELGVTDDEFLNWLADRGISTCDGCGWWEFDDDMLIASNGCDQLCDQC